MDELPSPGCKGTEAREQVGGFVSLGVVLGILRSDDENTDFFLMFANPVCIASGWRVERTAGQELVQERNVNITCCGKQFFLLVASLASHNFTR